LYNIVLLCQHGASTGMVAEKITEAAKKKGVDVAVNAYSMDKIAEVIGSAHIILLGPQVRYKLNAFQKEYGDKGVPIIAVEPTDYGTLNGENILNSMLEHLEK